MMEALFGFLGVLIGTSIPWIKEEWHRRRNRQENGRVSAVRIISMLDEYADKCSEVVSDNGTSQGRPAGRDENGVEYYIVQVSCPEPLTFPNDIDWKSISFDGMYRSLKLSETARVTDKYISASADWASFPYYDEIFTARQEGYARLGLEALDLSRLLREEFNLPVKLPMFWNEDWDMKVYLEEKLENIENQRSHNADINEQMTSNANEVKK